MSPTLPFRVIDSVAELEPADSGRVVVAGSHGAVAAARHAATFRPFGLILHDAGRGKAGGGASGLAVLDAMGIAAATVDGDTSRIGDGRDMLGRGVLSARNETAAGCGLSVGMTAAAALEALLASRAAAPCSAPMFDREGFVVADSITLLGPAHRGLVAVCGSHMGAGTVRYADALGLAAIIGHDAGIGRDGAGIAALPLWDERGVAAAAASAASARIGDGRDVLAAGILSAVNGVATGLGLAPGWSVRAAANRLVNA